MLTKISYTVITFDLVKITIKYDLLANCCSGKNNSVFVKVDILVVIWSP